MAGTMQMVKDLTLALSKKVDTYSISILQHKLDRRESSNTISPPRKRGVNGKNQRSPSPPQSKIN